ncbi:MAG: hypothetical protein ABI623_03855 [bacterium]
MKFRRFLYSFVSLVLAANYFAFQVELFDDEYEANHPKASNKPSITVPSLNWESFDKNNAPQAFTFDACLHTEHLFLLPNAAPAQLIPFESFKDIRDKSPPALSLT